METTEIKSRVKNTVKVMWFVAFLWVVYSSGRKLWEYLFPTTEQLAKEIILAYKKTIPTWSDFMLRYDGNLTRDTLFIDVSDQSVSIQYKMLSMLLLDNGKVVTHTQRVIDDMISLNLFEVSSILQNENDKVFYDILDEFQQNKKIQNMDYKTLQQMVEDEEVDSL